METCIYLHMWEHTNRDCGLNADLEGFRVEAGGIRRHIPMIDQELVGRFASYMEYAAVAAHVVIVNWLEMVSRDT